MPSKELFILQSQGYDTVTVLNEHNLRKNYDYLQSDDNDKYGVVGVGTGSDPWYVVFHPDWQKKGKKIPEPFNELFFSSEIDITEYIDGFRYLTMKDVYNIYPGYKSFLDDDYEEPKRVKKGKKRASRRSSKSSKKRSHLKFNRPSPPQSATEFAVGTRKKGNDNKMYIVKKSKNGVLRWA